jgi:hypothetical protein
VNVRLSPCLAATTPPVTFVALFFTETDASEGGTSNNSATHDTVIGMRSNTNVNTVFTESRNVWLSPLHPGGDGTFVPACMS